MTALMRPALSENVLNRSHQILRVVDINLIIRLTFSDSSRIVAMATDFGTNRRDLPTPPAFSILAFRKKLKYGNTDFRRKY